MTDTGVVGELGVPSWVVDQRRAVVARWAALPRLAQVFLALTALDIVGRLIGLLGPRLDLFDPVGTASSLLYRDLVIAFPAVLILRRRDAASATPTIVAGAVVLAIVTLVATELRLRVASFGAITMASLSLGLLASLLTIAALVAIGWGLLELDPPSPSPFVTGLANLVALVLVGAGLVGLLLTGLSTEGLPTPGENELFAINQVISGLGRAIAWAFVFRAVVRGLEDATRPRRALRASGLAVALAALLGVVAAVIGTMQLVARAPLVGLTIQRILLGLTSGGLPAVDWLGTVGAPSLLILAFGLGLADPFDRYVLPEEGSAATNRP